MRIDKPELRVESVCFFCPEQWRLQYGLELERGRRGDQGPIMAVMFDTRTQRGRAGARPVLAADPGPLCVGWRRR
jgi:hypothetical protein